MRYKYLPVQTCIWASVIVTLKQKVQFVPVSPLDAIISLNINGGFLGGIDHFDQNTVGNAPSATAPTGKLWMCSRWHVEDTRSQLDSGRVSGPHQRGSVHCLGVYTLLCLVTSPGLETSIRSQTLFQHCTTRQHYTGPWASTRKSNLTLTTFLKGQEDIKPPEHNHFAPQQSHSPGSAVSLLRKTHPVPLLADQAGTQQQPAPQPPYLLQSRAEPCRIPSPSTSSRCSRSSWPSCCSVTPYWSGRCSSPAGQRTSWCLNDSSSPAPAATGGPEPLAPPCSSSWRPLSTQDRGPFLLRQLCKHFVPLLPNHNLIFLCKKNKD